MFTSTQIARALGKSRQAVSTQIGAAAAFWDLPLDWQLEITRRGVERGFQNGEEFLSKLAEPWRSPIAWDQISKSNQEKALKLQCALARALHLRDGGQKGSEVEQVGMEDFQKAFGYPLKDARHLRRLLQRTVERDGGAGNWQR